MLCRGQKQKRVVGVGDGVDVAERCCLCLQTLVPVTWPNVVSVLGTPPRLNILDRDFVDYSSSSIVSLSLPPLLMRRSRIGSILPCG